MERAQDLGIVGPSEQDIQECNRLTGPVDKPRWQTIAKAAGAVVLPSAATVFTACLSNPPHAEVRPVLVEPIDRCDRPFPQVCTVEGSRSWVITWNRSAGDAVKNNIYHKNLPNETYTGVAAIGPTRLILIKDDTVDNLRRGENTLQEGLRMAINPSVDHRFIINSCSTTVCKPSEEITIPKK